MSGRVDDFHFSIVQVHFFCWLNFIVLFPFFFNITIFCLLLYLYLVVISSFHVSFNVFTKESVTGCDSSLGGGWTIFQFQLCKSILFFVNWISLCLFHLLYCIALTFYFYCIWLSFNTLLFCFFDEFLLFFSLGISHGMWLHPWEFLLVKSVLLLVINICTSILKMFATE